MKIAIAGIGYMGGQNMAPALLNIARPGMDLKRALEAAEIGNIEKIILYDKKGVPERFMIPGLVETIDAGDDDKFCASDADLFYLALQPQQRAEIFGQLVTKGKDIFIEKPITSASNPEECRRLEETITAYGAMVDYDYLLLKHAITDNINDYLRQYDHITIDSIDAHFQKNRESRHNHRNLSPMETVEIQELGHPISVCLSILAEALGKQVSFPSLFPYGIIMEARSSCYDPENATEYDHKVNGYTDVKISVPGGPPIRLKVNFKRLDRDNRYRPTPSEKWVTIKGCGVLKETGERRSFTIRANYQQKAEELTLDGKKQDLGIVRPYEDIWIRTINDFRARHQGVEGRYTDHNFAALVYQLGIAAWQSAELKDKLGLTSGSISDYSSAYKYAHHRKYWQSRFMAEPIKRLIDRHIDSWAEKLQKK